MRSGTLFPAVSVLLVLVVVGIVAVPDALTRLTVRHDVAAVRLLQEVALAQHRARAAGFRDADGDGLGEYLHLEDLARPAPDGRPWLALSLSPGPDADTLAGEGYLFRSYLPDAEGRPLPFSRRDQISPPDAALAYLAIAFPEEPGRTGVGFFCVGPDFLVRERARLLGPDSRIRLPLARIVHRTPGRGALLPRPDAAAWPVLLGDSQREWFAGRFADLGLPLPDDLAPTTPRRERQ